MKAKNWLLAMAVACAMAWTGSAWGVSETSAAVTVRTQGLPVQGHAVVGYPPFSNVGSSDEAGIWLDGTVLFSSVGEKTFDWQPQTTGNHTFEFRLNGVAVTSKTVNVSSLAFWVQKAPNPPTAVDSNLSITPVTRNFGTGGGGAAIVVSGSGTWQASVSDSWITLNATSGAAGEPVAYLVGAATNAESRTGYVYVSGHVHTVTQDGLGAVISPESATFESAGGTGTITVTPPDRVSWRARANVDWINVSPTSGTGAGTVTFTVAPLNENEVVARQGTLTVGGQTFKVTQKAIEVEVEYETKLFGTDGGSDSISIHLDGQVSWTAVSSDKTWITIFGGGSGTGDGEILYIVSPYVGDGEARTGTITVGDKVVYISQRTYDLSLNPSSVSVSGNNGKGEFGVETDVSNSWTAIATETWISLVAGGDGGMGSGVVKFTCEDNDTGKIREGKIIVAGEVFTVQQQVRTVEVFPEAGDEAEVAAALAGAADGRLGEKIRSVEEYEAFRAWIAEKGLDQQEVKESEQAWISYALGAEELFENEPVIAFGGVSVEGGGASVSVSVSVKDGVRDAEVDATKLAGMFEATGSLENWGGDAKLSATATPTGSEGATMQFEVVPSDGTAREVFLRIAP